MDVKVTNGDVLNLVMYLGPLTTKTVSGPGSMALALRFRALARELGPIDQDIREVISGLHKEYGKKDEKGELVVVENRISFEGDSFEKFSVAYNELLGQEVVIRNYIPEVHLVSGADWLGEVEMGFVDALYPFIVR